MSAWTVPLILQSGLTRLEMLNAMRQGLGRPEPRPELYPVVLGIVAAAGLLILIPHLLHLRRRRAGQDYLARAVRRLGLGRAERRALRRIARRARLAQPVSMLLSPGNLAFALHAAVGDDQGRLRRRAEVIARHVFGVGLPATAVVGLLSDNPPHDPHVPRVADPNRRQDPPAAPAYDDAERLP